MTRPRTAPPRKPLLRRLGDVVDAVVMAFSPERGISRQAARKRWDWAQERIAQARSYEGAEHSETRGDRWMASRLSATDALEQDLEDARHRSRELYRNDAIGGAIDTRVNHVVGANFSVQARVLDDAGELDADLNRALEGIYEQWALRCDRTHRRSLWQQLRLIERTHACDGEALVVLSDLGRSDKPVPLTVELIDTDRLMTPPERSADPRVRLGIEYDPRGQIVAYHVRKQSPFDSRTSDLSYERIPAERVLHVFEPWLPEQSRGLPWMIRVLNKLRDIKDLDEAAIIQAQVEAQFAAFVRTTGGGALSAALGATSATTSAGQRLQDLQPGTIRYLNPGEEIEFANPNRSGGNFGPFQKMNWQRVAGGMNFPYEMLARDWSGVSFAGGRLSLTDAKIDCHVRRRLMVELALIPIWWRFVDEAVIVGAVPIDARDYRDDPIRYRRHQWYGPGWEYAINPTEDLRAEQLAVNANFKTRAQVVAEKFGADIEQVDAERARERARERELLIVPPELAQGMAALSNAGSEDKSSDVDETAEAAA